MRTADARFLLPSSPGTAAVEPGLDGWQDALLECGLEVGASHPDVTVVSSSGSAPRPAGDGAVLVVSPNRRDRAVLGRDGYDVVRYGALPAVDDAELFFPLDDPRIIRYVLTRWLPAPSRWKALRNRVLASASGVLGLPPMIPRLLVGAPDEVGLPYLVAEAGRRGFCQPAGAFLALGGGDSLSRAVFHVFGEGSDEPSWIVKFSRVPGYTDPFERGAAGLGLAAGAPDIVRSHAPVLEGALVVDGLRASVESAAVGETLDALLSTAVPRRRKLAAIEQAATWLIEVGRATTGARGSVGPVVDAIRESVLSQWAPSIGPEIFDGVTGLPSVFVHGDPSGVNLVVGRDDIMAVDWEDADASGFPLWDVLHFAADVLPSLEGVATAGRADAVVALFRGELPTSPRLFDWIRRAADASGVPAAAVGALTTLFWLSSAGWFETRRDAATHHGVEPLASPDLTAQVAPRWLSEPGLGSGWSAWRS